MSSASEAGLRYASDASPGIRRRRVGAGFAYLRPDSRPVRDAATLRRIRSLAIPPAWTDVWISSDPLGHVQATGRDARGRKQYRYHPRWRTVRDAAKFDRMVAFGRALPRLRARVARDLALPGFPREKVVAIVVRLLETTLVRVGNEEYARANSSYGLTTLRNEHAAFPRDGLVLEFRGKGGKSHRVHVEDARLARTVRALRELPGQELFQYVDPSGARRSLGSADVNAYLREAMGADFTAKDFRTWGATVLAATALARARDAEGRARVGGARRIAAAQKREVARAIEVVAGTLGNTPSICRTCYVHPAVVQAHLDGALARTGAAAASRIRGLHATEAAVLRLLQRRPAGARRRVVRRVRRISHVRSNPRAS